MEPTLHAAAEDYEDLREHLRAKFPEYDLEIRDGDPVIMSPHDAVSSFLVIRLGRHLDAWAQSTGAWWVFDSNGGFRFEDGDLLAPDVSVISRARLPQLPRDWATGIPEVAFEVRSSRDRLPALRRRVDLLLEKGCGAVVVVDPDARALDVSRAGNPAAPLAERLELPELPGFALAVAELWP